MNKLEKRKEELAKCFGAGDWSKVFGFKPVKRNEFDFKCGFDTGVIEHQKLVEPLIEILEMSEVEMLTIQDHIFYGKMSKYDSSELTKIICKIQQVLKIYRESMGEK